MATDSKKHTIFYARTYRHLRRDPKGQIAFMLFAVAPVLVAFLLTYPQITESLAKWTGSVLADSLGHDGGFPVDYHAYIPFLGPVAYVGVEATMPSAALTLGTAVTCLLAAFVLTTGKRRGVPTSIFMLFAVVTQLVSCVFFFVDGSVFPYQGTDYSALYMVQQVGIWLFFIIIAGFAVGLISYGGLLAKVLTFVGILAYSFVFGCVRYVTYLFVVAKFSSLFMATLFFSLGPFFDFLYLVFLYSLYVDRLNKTLNRRDRSGVWQWA